MNVLRNVVQNPMREIPKTQARRRAVPVSRDQNVGLGFGGRVFPGQFGRYPFAFASIGGRNVAARAETDALQNDRLWDRGVIGPIDIARARGAHIRKCDEDRRQHENREDCSAEELHRGSVADLVKMVRPAGLLGAARLALRVALKGDRRCCATSSNPTFLCRGFDSVARAQVLCVLATPVIFRSLLVTPWSLNPFSTAEDGVDTGKHEFQSPARDLANAISEDLPVQSDSKRDLRDGILR